MTYFRKGFSVANRKGLHLIISLDEKIRSTNFNHHSTLAHKCAALNTLLHRADKLCDQESEQKKEIDLVRSTLKQNGYPDRLLHRKKPANATKNQERETIGLAILPYLPGLTDQIKRCSTADKIQVASKPVKKLANLLSSGVARGGGWAGCRGPRAPGGTSLTKN